MTAFALCLLLLFAITEHSSATYCICKDGGSDPTYQKDIDYACGAGADCSAILQNGACYNPNTVKDHCNYAVNSYFQRRGQAIGSCNFSNTATTTESLTTNQVSGCIYPSSPSTGTPSTGAPPPPGTPSTGAPLTPSPPGVPSTTIPSPPSAFGFGPTGSNLNPDGSNNSGASFYFYSFTLTLLIWGFMFLNV